MSEKSFKIQLEAPGKERRGTQLSKEEIKSQINYAEESTGSLIVKITNGEQRGAIYLDLYIEKKVYIARGKSWWYGPYSKLEQILRSDLTPESFSAQAMYDRYQVFELISLGIWDDPKICKQVENILRISLMRIDWIQERIDEHFPNYKLLREKLKSNGGYTQAECIILLDNTWERDLRSYITPSGERYLSERDHTSTRYLKTQSLEIAKARLETMLTMINEELTKKLNNVDND